MLYSMLYAVFIYKENSDDLTSHRSRIFVLIHVFDIMRKEKIHILAFFICKFHILAYFELTFSFGVYISNLQ